MSARKAKHNHGGARAGAGRKPTQGPTVSKPSAVLDAHHDALLRALCERWELSASETLKQCLRQAAERELLA